MSAAADPVSVLVIDESPDILAFFARLLDANNIRALLARGAEEAIGIAEREYVPVDLILTNVLLSDSTGLENGHATDLVNRLRRLRPHAHALYMFARVDSGVIRFELLERRLTHMARKADVRNLIDTIRDAASRPRVRTAR